MVNKGDILLLRVTFSDGKGSKVRPCLIISKYQKDFTYLEISSREYLEDNEYTVLLPSEKYTALKKSYVKIWKINTKDTIELVDKPKVLASLGKEDLDKVLDKLQEYIKAPVVN